MADIDYQKDKVAFWRMLFFFFLTAIFGIIAYLYENLFTIDKTRMILAIIGLIVLIAILIGISIKMSKEMKKLKDL
jgi:uncharacterized membrane protein HdeD (DUF308 family)